MTKRLVFALVYLLIFSQNPILSQDGRQNAPDTAEFSKNGWNNEPHVTPDGKYIFYTKNRDIYWVSIKILKNLNK